MNIVGNWSLNNNAANWEFVSDGKFNEKYGGVLQNTGTWEIVDDMIVVKYDNKDIGYSVLSFDDEDIVVGENKHRNGNMFNLNLKRIV